MDLAAQLAELDSDQEGSKIDGGDDTDDDQHDAESDSRVEEDENSDARFLDDDEPHAGLHISDESDARFLDGEGEMHARGIRNTL